jgi:two-component system, LytTR family, response regulator
MEKPLRLIIVEDELDAIELLSGFINEYCPELILVGIAQNVTDAIELINLEEPDVLMLDVSLGSESCFDVLERVDSSKFQLVFTTAYTKYAFDAFQYDAAHYLLKPYSLSEIKKAISKVQNNIQLKSLKNEEKFFKVQGIDGAEIIKLNDITHVLASRSYSTIYTSNGNQYTQSRTLKALEEELDSDRFIRCHHSCLINIDFINRLKVNDKSDFIVMNNGDEFPISRRKKEEVLRFLNAK